MKEQGAQAILTGQQEISRRQFLRNVGVAASAVTAGTWLSACGSSASPATGSSKHLQPKRGGVLRAGLTGGGTSDSLDAQDNIESLDLARCRQLYNQLLEYDTNAVVQPALADLVEPNSAATAWTIHLKRGVSWHNGKEFTAEDVIFSFRRIANPKKPLPGAASMALIDTQGLKQLDKYTVHVPCHAPFSTLKEVLPGAYFFMVPKGYDPRLPVGTGPFKYKSFTPGQQSVFVRNDSYWKTGLPYADSVVTLDFADSTSQLNALASGQVDMVDLLTADAISTVQSGGGHAIISKGGGIVPFTMRVDSPPFNDVRVRQAMRLIVDRPKMREVVYGGYGLLGNDITSIWDPEYDHSIPQRHQDIEQAKSLLKKAGHENLTVTLVTAPVASGTGSAAQVIAQQAKAAGVTININQVTPTDLYGPSYLKWVFAQDYFLYNPYFLQVAQSFLPTSPFNETHWNDPHYTALYHAGLAAVEDAKRTEIVHEMQRIEFDSGGYIIAAFPPYVDGVSSRVHGVTPGHIYQLSDFGFERFWLS